MSDIGYTGDSNAGVVFQGRHFGKHGNRITCVTLIFRYLTRGQMATGAESWFFSSYLGRNSSNCCCDSLKLVQGKWKSPFMPTPLKLTSLTRKGQDVCSLSALIP